MADTPGQSTIGTQPSRGADSDQPGYGTPRSGVDKAKLHKEMLGRHDECWDYWRSEYNKARDDMIFAFTPDDQWDDWMRAQRNGRPMYTVNKLRQAMKQITNDQRQNRPQAKVRAVEDGDADLAEVRQGILRSIDSQLDAQRAVDTAFQFAVGGGFGVWRVNAVYVDDDFDPVIQREEIANPYTVAFDPAAKKKDRRDARYAFVDCQWARSAFKARWPNAKMVSVDTTTDANRGWWSEAEVTVAEYWYKKTEQVEIVRMSDGSIHDAEKLALIIDELAAQGITIQRRRIVEREKVYQCIVSGAEILEGPTEWAGKFIPLVPVWGELLNLNGKDTFFGAVRFAKDAQRMYNYERSLTIEYIGDQPYSPYMADAESIEGYTDQWQAMRTRRPPVLLYKSNPALPNGGKPSREAPPAFPAALAQSSAMSSDDIKAATGIYDASLGARSNETSGKAIIARQREGDVANFDYMDNLAYALKFDYEIENDLITALYSTERQIRIVGEDGAEKVVKVNHAVQDTQTGQWVTMNDLTQGRYDVSVTVGPSYTTQRMEAADAMEKLVSAHGPAGALAMYGLVKSLDAPGLEDIRKGFRKMLVGQGLLEPEEGEQPPAPPQPNPKDIADAKQKEASAQLDAAKAEGQGIQNQKDAFEFGVQVGATAPPMPPPMNFNGPPPGQPNPLTQQPPNGGFFVPAQTAPGGIPGMPQ